MKKTLLFALISIPLAIQAQEILEFEGQFPSASAEKKYVMAHPDDVRLKSDIFGKFKVEFSGFNEEQKYAFQMALKLWEEAIPLSKEVTIHATFNASGANAYTASVHASKNLLEDPLSLINYPMSLLVQKSDLYNDERTDPDITINFNQNLNLWDFNTDASLSLPEGKFDFVTEAMRAIAKGLGFGSSLIGREGNISFQGNADRTYIFDHHVRNANNDRLYAFEARTPELNAFVKNPAYWDRGNYTDYQLYTPADVFNKYTTLLYFNPSGDNEKLLLEPQCNGRIRHIGSKILDVLQDIGWQRAPEFKVTNNQLPESGIIDHQPGRSLTFACTPDPFINNYKWTFQVVQKDATYRTISTSTSSNFTIGLPQKYTYTDDRTSSGAVKCLIHLTATTSDNRTLEADYALFVNYFPEIPVIDLIQITPKGDGLCKLELGFSSLGADSYTVDVDDEDAFLIWDVMVHQTGYAKCTIDDLFIGSNYTFIVKAISSRGNSSSAPLVFHPINNPAGKIEIEIQDENIILQKYDRYGNQITDTHNLKGGITDVNGQTVKIFRGDAPISTCELKKGVYIIHAQDSSGQVYTQKFVK